MELLGSVYFWLLAGASVFVVVGFALWNASRHTDDRAEVPLP